MRVLDLKLTYKCNNDCKYCCQERSLRKAHSELDIAMVKKIVEQEQKKGIDKVVLTGGEPTLNTNLGDIVLLLSENNIKNIQLQTNGRNLKNREYLEYLIKCGVSSFGISLHGFTQDMHEAFTGTPQSFDDVIIALHNIRDTGIPVALNCVITRHNVMHLEDILLFVEKQKLASSLQFAFIHITGKAEEGIADYVSISEAANQIKKLASSIHTSLRLTTEAIPLCLMYGCEKMVSELTNNADIVTYDYRTCRDFSNERISVYKTKFLKCKNCLFDSHCEGTWIEYPNEYGEEEFIPVKYFRSNYNEI